MKRLLLALIGVSATGFVLGIIIGGLWDWLDARGEERQKQVGADYGEPT
jgi:hypothetical protein